MADISIYSFHHGLMKADRPISIKEKNSAGFSLGKPPPMCRGRTPERFAKFNRRRNSRSVWTAVSSAPLLSALGTSTIPASPPARQRR
jgi:hypothetical protein